MVESRIAAASRGALKPSDRRPRSCRTARRIRFASALLAALLGPLLTAGAQAGTFVQGATLQFGGLTRYYDYYLPDGAANPPLPVVFVLHGGTQSSADLATGPMSVFHGLADQHHFLAIYPNGTSASTGQTGPSGSFNWNDCRTDAGAASTTADDVGFISALIDWAATQFAIDPTRIYATGASDGGLMSYRLAFELSDRIAAVAAIIANLPVHSECPPLPTHPVSVLIMNGTAETYFMPWGGGQVAGNRGEVESATATRDFWQAFLAADPSPRHVDLPDLDPSDGGDVGIDVFCGGQEGTTLYFYTVNGAGHTVPSIADPIGAGAQMIFGKQNHDMEAATEIWRFFARRRLHATPAPGACSECEQRDCRQPIEAGDSTLDLSTSPSLKWKWAKGAATATGDFGDPVHTDDYALCLYDESGSIPSLALQIEAPAARSCGTTPCWRAKGTTGFAYSDPSRSVDGLTTLRLKAGPAGKTRTKAKASGPSFPTPPPLPLALPARMQLQAGNGQCWEAPYLQSGARRNDASAFKGRDGP